jgi:hypothetical protein
MDQETKDRTKILSRLYQKYLKKAIDNRRDIRRVKNQSSYPKGRMLEAEKRLEKSFKKVINSVYKSRNSLRPLIVKVPSIEGLILGRSGDFLFDRQVAQKVLEISSLNLTGILFSDKSPETPKPDEIGLLCAERSVPESEGLAHLFLKRFPSLCRVDRRGSIANRRPHVF